MGRDITCTHGRNCSDQIVERPDRKKMYRTEGADHPQVVNPETAERDGAKCCNPDISGKTMQRRSFFQGEQGETRYEREDSCKGMQHDYET